MAEALAAAARAALGAARARSVPAFYDALAPVYDRVFTRHAVHAARLVGAVARSGAGGPVLDLGCGTGLVARALSAAGIRAIGLDRSPASLAVLRSAHPKTRAVLADAADLPFLSRSFDGVVCLGAWRHFTRPARVAAECARVLRDGGVLAIGYFPPRLFGVWPSRGALVPRAYALAARLLGHADAVDARHERRTVGALRARFEVVRRVASAGGEHLLIAERPRRASATH
jgi:ubiquinone/menaquinone biosynthesis C-methylase UbiE